MSSPSPQRGDALIVVDVQRDFCPGGKLAVAGGDEVVGVLNRWINAAVTAGAEVLASRDWHPPGHCSFREEGGPWPEHCVQGTPGAEFHPELRLPEGVTIVSKGTSPAHDNYSAFDETGLGDLLDQRGITRVFVGGLAQDICVRATVMDACRLGLEVHVIADGTRPVDVEAGRQALQEMREAGAIIER